MICANTYAFSDDPNLISSYVFHVPVLGQSFVHLPEPVLPLTSLLENVVAKFLLFIKHASRSYTLVVEAVLVSWDFEMFQMIVKKCRRKVPNGKMR